MAKRTSCFVPGCGNTSKTKHLIAVPFEPQRRKQWFEAVMITRTYAATTKLFCCEDHFNLENDLVNFVFFKEAGKQLKMKPHVVPRFNLNSPRIRRPEQSQVSDSSKKRKRKFQSMLSLETETSAKRPKGPEESTGHVPSNVGGSRRNLDFESLPNPDTESVGRLESSTPTGLTSPTFKLDPKIRRRKQVLFGIPDPDERILDTIVPSGIATTAMSVPLVSPVENLAVPLSDSPVSEGIGIERNTTTAQTHETAGPSSHGDNTIRHPSISSRFRPRREESTESSRSRSTTTEEVHSDFTPSQIVSSESLAGVLEAVDLSSGSSREIALITRDPRFYLGLPKEEFRIINMASNLSNLSARDIMLTIKKIRLDDSNKRLAYDFNLSIGHVSKIFVKTVQQISNLFQQFVFWPSQKTIQQLLPISFRHRFSDVQSIIDCFEIEIEKPSKPKNQALTWSEYKKCNTVKILISCTPYGFINFLSKSYGGRISDKTIVLKSGYMDVVPTGSSVLADRGFKQIEGELAKKQVQLIRPASVKASEIPSKAEIRESRSVAATRIHVERVISRIREFRFLGPHSRIDHQLIRLVDHCTIVAAAIVNLQEPIIKNEKVKRKRV